MSLYEYKSNKNLIDKELAKSFLTIKNFTGLMLAYGITVTLINISSIFGDGFYNTPKGLVGYFFGFSIIALSASYLMNPKSIYLLLISCIYTIGVVSVIPLINDSDGYIVVDSFIFYGDSFWFLTVPLNILNLDISVKTMHYLQFLPAAIIFGALYYHKKFKNEF